MTDASASAFEQARTDSQSLPVKPDNLTLLRLYALYKQGSLGDVQGERPGGFDFVGGAKYDAWAELRGTSQQQAQSDYVALVGELKGS
ncbi:acyl-CoA-binding protein [Deinococcus sp.]|uniref:acyl-CoA-binding protein n=1 Tax=Deinococcus sp. TaxID=47478 RepID=UPI0025EDA071|nr:acyl-CoA-binding protein [Deinococcus sp.]